jgi:hypothetical protein
VVILVGWLYWWSAPTLVGEPSWSPNKVGRGTGTYIEILFRVKQTPARD